MSGNGDLGILAEAAEMLMKGNDEESNGTKGESRPVSKLIQTVSYCCYVGNCTMYL